MPKYTVELDADAEDESAAIYLQTSDALAVVRADAAITAALSADPAGAGTPLSEGLYRLVVPPLAYLYGIDETRQLVRVVGVGTVA